jgi:GMP synthase-like glutamine amidotransferase
MNPELIKILNRYSVTKDSSRSTVKSLLNGCIPAKMYDEVEGESIEDKINTVFEYLDESFVIIKEKLNIIIADGSSSLEYVRFLEKKFEVTVYNFKELPTDVKIDLVLFTGGEDISPEFYNEKVGKYTNINGYRDTIESEVYDYFYGKVLFLGICRGSQMLTVLSGGKLIQHAEGHGRDHNIIVNSTVSRYVMTSSHHQMLFPFNLPKDDYELIAHSEFFQSTTYLNGDNEEIELPIEFLEPEIVYYKNTKSLCIQGHPEWSYCEKNTSMMCLNLISKYLKNK